MYNNVFNIDKNIINGVVKRYKEFNNIKSVMNYYKLSFNEVLAILDFKDVKVKKRDCFEYSINNNRLLMISDTHIGSKKCNIDNLDIVYEYAKKYSINNIIHTGDLLHSNRPGVLNKYMDPYNQVEYLLDIYPFDKYINNYILFGNHDYHLLKDRDDLYKNIDSRVDFNLLGYKRAYLDYLGYLISVYHSIDKYKMRLPNEDTIMSFCGHRHEFNIESKDKIMVPTLSNDLKDYGNYNFYPGFLEIYMNNESLNIILHNIIDKKVVGMYRYEKKLNYKFKI